MKDGFDVRRGVARSCAVLRALGVLALLACGADVAPHEAPGAVALPVTIATDSALYRLQGSFAVRDVRADAGGVRRVRTEDNPDASALVLRLDAGDYEVLLEPGWTVRKESAAGAQTVPAELAGDNPVTVRVAAGMRATASFRLQVEGVERTLEEGTLAIDVDIEELPPAVCGNGRVERGEACDGGPQNGEPHECDATCLFRCEGPCPLRLDPSAAAGGDGKTWATAARDLGGALGRAGGGEIWMRGGEGIPREVALGLQGVGITLRGGFDGSERTPDERSPSTPRTRLPAIEGSEDCRFTLERVQLGAPPTFEGSEQRGSLRVRGCTELTVRDAALYNASVEIEATRTRFERVDAELAWAQPMQVTRSHFAWVGGGLRWANDYASLVTRDSRVLLQDLSISARVDLGGDAESLIVGTRFEGGNSTSGGGTLTASRATIVDSSFADFGSGGRTPILGGSLFIFNSSFVNLAAGLLRNVKPGAAAIEGTELEIVASTFHHNACRDDSCYYDVIGARRVIASLFVQEDPQESSNQPPGQPVWMSVDDPSVLSGSCSTFAVGAFTLGPRYSGEVLATSHPCPDGASAAELESARKRLVTLTAPFRTAFFAADVGRFDSPDWWKRRSVRAGRCTDEGAPDPGRHHDVPCPAR